MREIKFRIWNGRRIVGVNKNDFFSIRNDGLISSSDSDKCILMQYTGLQDKNAVDIYEGDVVQTVTWVKSVIVYMEALCKFVGTDNYEDNGCYLFEMYEPDNIEVIGNIYENPELLGGE